METAFLLIGLAGALWLGLAGIRDLPHHLREGPDSLKPPKWWLWRDGMWLAAERASVVGTFFMVGAIPAVALRLLDLEDSTAYLAVGAVLAGTLVLVVSTFLFGRPKSLAPRRLRDGPNVLAEWFLRGDAAGGWTDRE